MSGMKVLVGGREIAIPLDIEAQGGEAIDAYVAAKAGPRKGSKAKTQEPGDGEGEG